MNICQNWKYNFQKFSMAAFCVYKRRTCVMIFLAFNWSRLMGFLLYHFHNVSEYWHIKNCYKVPRWCQEAKGNTQNTLYHCQYLVVNKYGHFYCLTFSIDQCWMILTKILTALRKMYYWCGEAVAEEFITKWRHIGYWINSTLSLKLSPISPNKI